MEDLPNRRVEFLIVLLVLSAFGVFALLTHADPGLVAAVLTPITTLAGAHAISGHWSDRGVRVAALAARPFERSLEHPSPFLPPIETPGPEGGP